MNQENEVLSYVSGINFRGDFDLLMSEYSLPASRFKVPVCAVAIEKMIQDPRQKAAHILDMPLPTQYEISKNRIIRDPGREFITLRDAMIQSRNAALYWLTNRITSPEEVVDFLQYFDVNLQAYPSIPMGTQPVSEFKLAWIYSTLLTRDGFLKKPTFIREISSSNGKTIYESTMPVSFEPRVVSSTTCKIIKQLLRESRQRGTSNYLASIDSLEIDDVSPKTGTTRKFRQLGVTGGFNDFTFSLLIEGKNFKKPASEIAVPILASLLQCMQRNGYR